MLALDANDDAFGIDRIDDSVTLCQNDRARVARGNALHPGAHNRSLRPQQRYRLALHVRAHQGAVRVVMLEKWHQRGRDRHELLRADVDVIHFVAMHQHEVARLAGVDQFAGDAALVVQFNIGLRDGVPVFFPSGEIERERLDLDRLLFPVLEIELTFSISLFSA